MTGAGDIERGVWRQRGDDLSWREIDEEVIVLDLRSASYLRLNPTGAFLWGLLERGATLLELTERLADRFALDARQAQADAVAFVASCRSKGIVERLEA